MMKEHQENSTDTQETAGHSSRLISLSGWSGVAVGVVALAAAFAIYITGYTERYFVGYLKIMAGDESVTTLLLIAITAIVLALVSGFYFTGQKWSRNRLPKWGAATGQLIFHFATPLIAGGLVCITLIYEGYFGLLSPLTLIFYGSAIVSAGKFTHYKAKYLGVLQVVLGLLALRFTEYGLLFWTLGFGVLHGVYGMLTLDKMSRKTFVDLMQKRAKRYDKG